MLEVKDLSVRYGSCTIVDHVSFTVEPGEWLMIIGPNGAGKSTLLGAITGGAGYTGTALLNGCDLRHMKSAERAREMGFLAQNHFVNYAFTVEEVVRLGRYSHSGGFLGTKAEDGNAAVEEALRLTGMEKQREQNVLTLSGGELQRTFLAQVFAQDPKLLLLDEPTNHLDLIYQKQVFSILTDWLKKPGRAVVSVVHDLSLARAYGTRALLMDGGKTVALGPVEEATAPERLNGVYGMDVAEWLRGLLRQWN